MQSSKLLATIRSFNEEEVEQFVRYSNIMVDFEKGYSEILRTMLDFIITNRDQQEDNLLSKKTVFAILYPKETYSKSKIEHLMYRLHRITKKFIINQSDELETTQLLKLADFYKTKKLHQLFNSTIKEINKKQETEHRKSLGYYQDKFFLEQEILNYHCYFNKRNEGLNVVNTLEALDAYYLITKLEYACLLLSQSMDTPLPKDEVTSMVSMTKELIENTKELPILELYYLVFLMLQNFEEEQYYKDFTTLLHAHLNDISDDHIKSFQAYARNYCVEQYNRGKVDYLRQTFELYKFHLAQGYIYYDNKLMPGTFQTIISIATKFKQYDWILEFLVSHKDRLMGTSFPEDIYNFNLANYYFCIREYDKVIDCLKSTYDDPHYTIAAKRLEIKTYFEMQFVLLETKINNFKLFVYRMSNMPKERVEANNNFINMVKQILHPKTISNPKRIQKLIDKISSIKRITEKEWLLEKLEEMLN